MDWMLLPLKRYADFSGRSRRKEFWMFQLGITITYAVLMLLLLSGYDDYTGEMTAFGVMAMLIVVAVSLGVIIPALAVQVRRFHDQDKSGWFVLLNIIPYIGGIIVLVMMCLEGTNGSNRFGPDPKTLDDALPAVE